jgi:hypothetical protein
MFISQISSNISEFVRRVMQVFTWPLQHGLDLLPAWISSSKETTRAPAFKLAGEILSTLFPPGD